MVRAFVIYAEIVTRPFVVSADIVAACPLTARPEVIPVTQADEAKDQDKNWDDELLRFWHLIGEPYSEAIEAWYQSEKNVIRSARLAASASDDSAEYTSETAHQVRCVLARALVSRLEIPDGLEIPELCKV